MALRDGLMGDSSKLEGIPNYSVWSFKMQSLLNRDDVWRIVDPPLGTLAPTTPAEIAALEALKKKALSMIALSVHDNVIPYIVNIKEPDVCWNKLKSLYANGTDSRKLMLRRRLANLRMDEKETLTTFLRQVQELVNDFACVGEVIADRELVQHTLLALPASYEGLVNTVMYQSNIPSFADLTILLLEEDQCRALRDSKLRVDSEALLVRSGGRYSANRKPSNNTEDNRIKIKKAGATCHYCGKIGHWMKHCPELAAEVKRRRANRTDKPLLNLVDSWYGDSGDSDSDQVCNNDQLPVEVVEPELEANFTELNFASSQEEEWYLDSGASRHVTGQKQLLSNIREENHSKVSTAGGEKLNVLGKGSVNIPTSSGGIKFSDVLYVPEVTKNLLSMGTITDTRKGYKLLFDSSKVWILHDFLPPADHYIVTTGSRDSRNGLYRLRPPDTGEPSVYSATTDTKNQEALLWHRRLGHANYKTITFMAQ